MDKDIFFFDEAINRVNKYLKITGLNLKYENSFRGFWQRISNRHWFFFVFFSFNVDSFWQLCWFVDGAKQGKPLVELTYPAPCIAMCLLAIIKSYSFLKNEPLVIDLVTTLRRLQLSSNKKSANNEKIEKVIFNRMRMLKKISLLAFWLNTTGLIGFAIMPFLLMASTYSETGIVKLVLPYDVKYPFDVDNIRIWPFIYIRQLHSSSTIVFMVFGPDSLFYFAGTCIEIEFKILQYEISTIINHHFKGKFHENLYKSDLVHIVERHTDLIRCVDLLETINTKSTLLNVTSSSFIICLTLFNITTISNIPFLVPFIGFLGLALSQITFLCYFGENIMKSSMELSDAIYNSQWYNIDPKSAKDFLVIIRRTQKPCKLTACRFYDINLKTYTKILSTAWSYYTLLKSVNRN